MLGMSAKIVELAKEYKITGFPVDGSNTNLLYSQFKYIPVEIIQLKPSGGKMSGMSAKIIELAKEYKITGFPVDGSNTNLLYSQFKYIPVEVIQLKGQLQWWINFCS